jgi:hypothetical protein
MRKTAKGVKNKRTRKFRQTKKIKKQIGGGWPFKKKLHDPEPQPEIEKELSDDEIDADQLNRQKIAIDQMRMDNPDKDINEIYAELKNKQLNDMYRMYNNNNNRDVRIYDKDQYLTYEEPDDKGYYDDSATITVYYGKGNRGRYNTIRNNPGLLLPLSDDQIEEIKKENEKLGEYIDLEPNDASGGQKRQTKGKKKTRRLKKIKRYTIRR